MFRYVIPLLLAGFALQAGAAEEKEPFKVQSTLDIPYVSDGGRRQQLDVFRPEGRLNAPVLLLVHGGSWMFGDKDFHGLYRDVAVSFAQQGLVVVSANYRLVPWARHPQQVKDVARAFAWTRRN